MTVEKLEQLLIEENIPKSMYSLLRGDLPGDAYCLVRNGDKWEVYYSERGIKRYGYLFDTEDEACDYIYERFALFKTRKAGL